MSVRSIVSVDDEDAEPGAIDPANMNVLREDDLQLPANGFTSDSEATLGRSKSESDRTTGVESGSDAVLPHAG